ncbi:MAG: hypothetical protein ACT4OD_01055 [Candidatus Nitrosotenuis sp.]
MASTLKLVFSNYAYVGLAFVVFTVLFMLISVLSEYVFFEPYFIFHVPDDRIIGFTLIVAVSTLSGLVIPMNIYLLKTIRKASRVGGGFLGSLIGVSAGACSCGPVGFVIISTFGTIGGTTTAFLTAYEIPMRIASLTILGFVYYITNKSLNPGCKIR